MKPKQSTNSDLPNEGSISSGEHDEKKRGFECIAKTRKKAHTRKTPNEVLHVEKIGKGKEKEKPFNLVKKKGDG